MSGSVAVTRAIAVPGLLLLLIIATALSLLIGAKSLPASVVLEALSGTCQSADCTIVLDARLPRTLAGLLAGGALGLAGALMQTLTRNPLADPGLLGVNAGASFAIVLGAALFGYSSAQEQLAMAFAGALVASLIVAFTGSQGGGQLSPVRLTLAGVALAAVLEGLTSGIALLNPDVYDQLRFWQAGSLDIRNLHTCGDRPGENAPSADRRSNRAITEPRAEQFKPRQRHRDGAGQSRGAHTVNWSAGDYRALW